MLNDTIAAISTALQDGAISVIRISGPDSLAIAGRLFSRPGGRSADAYRPVWLYHRSHQ